MPFRMSNNPACFKRVINTTLWEFLGENVHIYLDDILISTEGKENHIPLVKEVLETLTNNGLY
jgi:Reverse transcriptase (RNA-dependent DNA polymerase)